MSDANKEPGGGPNTEVKRLKTLSTAEKANDSIRRKIIERKIVEAELDPEVVQKRERRRVYAELPVFFDQLYTFMRARKLRSMECGALAREMTDRALNKRIIHVNAALDSLKALANFLPEYCQIKPDDRGAKENKDLFILTSLPSSFKVADLRKRVVEESKRLLEED